MENTIFFSPEEKGDSYKSGSPQLNNSFFLLGAQSRQNIPIMRLGGGGGWLMQIVLTLEGPHNKIEDAKEAHNPSIDEAKSSGHGIYGCIPQGVCQGKC